MTVCKGCGAEIIFVKLDTGRSMPVDATPHPNGNVVAGRRDNSWIGYVTRKGDNSTPNATPNAPAGFNRYTPHWATCPQQAQFRKPKRRNQS